jgi:hypothetical protein
VVEDGLRDLDDGVVLRVCPYDGHGASDREAVVGVPQQPLQYGSVEERVRAPCVTDRAVGGGFGPRQVGLFSLLPPPLPSPGRHSATFVVEQSEFEQDPGAGRSCHKAQVDRRERGCLLFRSIVVAVGVEPDAPVAAAGAEGARGHVHANAHEQGEVGHLVVVRHGDAVRQASRRRRGQRWVS